jgi:hypothetical protein
MLGTDPQAPPGRSGPAAGDIRVVVALVEGKPAATLYRAVAADAPKAVGVLFESPVGKVAFDQVQSISDRIQLAVVKGHVECAIPLRDLQLKPAPGMELLADVGVLRGREGRTVQRSYWSNKSTVLVSDLPSEASLHPERWGSWVFR